MKWILLAVVVVGAFWFGPRIAARWTRFLASRCLEQRLPSASLEWVEWSQWLAPHDGEADLLRAKAYRQLNRDSDLYLEALDTARQKGASSASIEREERLHAIELGESEARGQQELIELIAAGESPHDVCTAFVFGYLHRQDLENAKRVLEAWEQDYPGDSRVSYVRGVLWRSAGDNVQAESAFRLALERQERHELAAIALARLCEQQGRVAEALEQWILAAKLFPSSDEAHIGLAQLLRKAGRVAEAREALAARPTDPNPSRELLLETSDIEFESGEYEEASRLLRAALFTGENRTRELLRHSVEFALNGKARQPYLSLARMRVVATALAFGGTRQRAEWLFDEVDTAQSRLQRRNDLRVRLGQDPQDKEALRELNELLARLPDFQDMASSETASRQDLYSVHCAACHGILADGNGPAARHLDPRPRDFRRDRFRLVSARNGLPLVEDVADVIRQGIPGTSMPAFPDLSPKDRQSLAEQVLQFRTTGVREQLAAIDRLDNSEPADEELAKLVKLQTTPDSAQTVPPMEKTPDASSLVRGQEAFATNGCHHCHDPKPETGHARLFFDEKGCPTLARNLASDPLKGGREPRSIFLRLRLGMPGTSHPASTSVPDEQLVDLVHYCSSLAQLPTASLTNYQRSLRSCCVQTAGEATNKGNH